MNQTNLSLNQEIAFQFLHNQNTLFNNVQIRILYQFACGYCQKFINQLRFSNKIVYFEKEDIMSLVYMVLIDAIKKYRWQNDPLGLNFKNYFYLIIRYKCYEEIKFNNNYQEIRLHHKLKNSKQYLAQLVYDVGNQDFDTQELIEKIYDFLKKKKPIYAQMFLLKLAGYNYAEMAVHCQLNPKNLRARFNYMKKIITKEFKPPHYTNNKKT